MPQPSAAPCPADPLLVWARLAPERIALVDRASDDRVSYMELDAAADRCALRLHAVGIGPGDRVATLSGNRRELVDLYFACGRVGAALVPLNWRLAPPELAGILEDAAPSLLLVEDRFRGPAERVVGSTSAGDRLRVGRLESFGREEADPSAAPGAAPGATAGWEAPRLLLYTSGSTGRPKGVVIPRRQIVWNAVATATGWQLGPDDVAPVSTPLFHTGGWNVFATPLWERGGTVVLLDGFGPAAFLDALAEERCTVALTVPTQLRMLREEPSWGRELPALRFLISGGAPCPASLADDVRAAGYRFREGYGLTECGPNCFAISDAEAERRPGSVGWPVPYLEARLRSPDGTRPHTGETGELQLRGPQLFGGYFRDPERTAAALPEEGWLRTGDLAHVDEDGAFTICGRSKEMFISGGENVFPGEVEAALAGCPGVAEAVVVGVPHEHWGEVGRAFVVRRADGEGSRLDGDALHRFARERLAGYKVPKSFVFLEEIPRLGSGKPDRRALLSRDVDVAGAHAADAHAGDD